MTRKISVKDRAFISGFVMGYVFGQHEAHKEIRQIGAEFEDMADGLRAEIGKTFAELREQWGIGGLRDPLAERTKTVQ